MTLSNDTRQVDLTWQDSHGHEVVALKSTELRAKHAVSIGAGLGQTQMHFFRLPLCALALTALFACEASSHVLAERLAPDECSAPPITQTVDHLEAANRLVPGLIDWIAENTDYDVDEARQEPPEISFCQTGDLIPYEAETVLVDDELNGAYDFENRRVILVHPWDPTDPWGQSILLHELIHHIQLLNRSFECVQAPEWEAYKLQDAFLSQNGVESGFDWLRVYFMSQCPRDIHP